MQEPPDTEQPEILPKFQDEDIPEMAARIMTVAVYLFAEKGYSATSVREIVQQADVTNPMLYYYFQSKAGLFSELVRYLFESMEEDVAKAISEGDTLTEKLDALIWAHLDACRRAPVVLSFVYSVLFGPQTNRPEFDIFNRHVRMLGSIVNIFEDAIERGELTPAADFSALYLTHQFFALLNGHLMRSLKMVEVIEPREKRIEYLGELLSPEEGRRLTQFFLSGAGTISEKEN